MQLRYISVPLLIAEAGGDPWAVNKSLQAGRPAQIADLAQAFHNAGQRTKDADTAFGQARERFEKSWNRDNGEHPINDSAEVQRATQTLGLQAAQLPNIAVDLENVAAALAEAQRSGGGQIATLETRLETLDDWIGQAENLIRQDDTLLAQASNEDDISALKADISRLQQYISDCEHEAIDDTKATLGQVDHTRDQYSDTLQNSLTNLRTDGYDPASIRAFDAPESPAKPEDANQLPPPGTSAKDVNKWWNSLSQEQKDRVIAAHPPELGNLDGIPVEARDAVNQKVMNDDIQRVENVAKQHRVCPDDVVNNPATYGLSATDITRYINATKVRDGLDFNGEKGPDGKRKNPVFLQTYEPEKFGGQGRAAIAIGNPDKADNTSVLVPGVGNSVRDGYLIRPDGLNVYKETVAADPGKSTSVMIWMGYDAPNSLTDGRVLRPDLAREGGALLASDVNGLELTHVGSADSHVTAIGHSYGSTTVADAAAGFGMHANDVVLVGSPGTDLAHSAADFHLRDGGHVYVGDASDDPITYSRYLEKYVENQAPGSAALGFGLGTDPAVDRFGSTRFKAEVPSMTWPWQDHSQYFTHGTESIYSIADIASGHGADLQQHGMTAPHRGEYGLPDRVDPELPRPGTGGHYHTAVPTTEKPR